MPIVAEIRGVTLNGRQLASLVAFIRERLGEVKRGFNDRRRADTMMFRVRVIVND